MMRGPDEDSLPDDDDDEDSGPEPEYKRPRNSGGFTDTSMDGPSAETQLEAMLAANDPIPGKPGMPGVRPSMPGQPGAPGMPGVPGAPGAAVPGMPKADGEARVETTPMDFSRLSRDLPSRSMPVPKELVEYLMTPEHRQLMTEQSGADVEWAPDEAQVKVRGSAEQVKRATRLLQRVLMHCNWGRSEDKVKRLLKPRMVESAICRLSPMNTLRPAEKLLSTAQPLLSIGKDKNNDVVIQDPIISRQHCILELDPERGAVYVIDCSTNGTFLNGTRLPAKTSGKVLVSHGDELLFKDPASGDMEFGYILNVTELVVKQEVKLEAPRRLLTPEETTSTGRDFA
mmetsp:Transcript_72407/g.212158  ORF Transcript_72407/g.212158 Transcript_72407/m.212158 type:complete len:342 (-) Transcript_72407:87-1112(-)